MTDTPREPTAWLTMVLRNLYDGALTPAEAAVRILESYEPCTSEQRCGGTGKIMIRAWPIEHAGPAVTSWGYCPGCSRCTKPHTTLTHPLTGLPSTRERPKPQATPNDVPVCLCNSTLVRENLSCPVHPPKATPKSDSRCPVVHFKSQCVLPNGHREYHLHNLPAPAAEPERDDTVDPSIWDKLVALLRRLPKDKRPDPDDVEPFI